jgi:hypothetical protein
VCTLSGISKLSRKARLTRDIGRTASANLVPGIPGKGLAILVDLDSRERVIDVYVPTLAGNACLGNRRGIRGTGN